MHIKSVYIDIIYIYIYIYMHVRACMCGVKAPTHLCFADL